MAPTTSTSVSLAEVLLRTLRDLRTLRAARRYLRFRNDAYLSS